MKRGDGKGGEGRLELHVHVHVRKFEIQVYMYMYSTYMYIHMCLYMFSALSLLLNPFLLFRLNDIRARKVKYSRLARETKQEIGMNTILIHVHVHVHCACVCVQCVKFKYSRGGHSGH